MSSEIETVNLAKRNHANAIVAQVDTLTALIDSEGTLWFGGLPPRLEQLKAILQVHKNEIKTVFGLE